MNQKHIKYSICICNRNMGDTLYDSLTSVLQQVSEDFEIILLDDGSKDNSKDILRKLTNEFCNLQVFYLGKDRNRRLGSTRNMSFAMARGEWCIFHIDADDIIGHHILDFTKIVEIMSARITLDCLFSGKQIHMAKRDFLLSNGPFKNIYRGEDRDLYQRLSLSNQWIIILHERFIHRIKRNKKKLLYKTILDSWDQMVTDMQMSPTPLKFLRDSLIRVKQIGFIRILFRLLFVLPALFAAKRRGLFLITDRINDYDQFAKYREENTKTLSEWKSTLGIEDENLIGINKEIFY